MGKALSKISRPLKNFNVENRATKIITKDKPTPAPRHPSTLKYLDTNEQFLETQKNEPKELLNRLKAITIKEEKNLAISKPENESEKSLPEITRSTVLPEIGIVEPKIAKQGNVKLSHVLEFLTKHQEDPEEWNSGKIAKQYKLDIKTTEYILEYYKILTLKQLTQRLVTPKINEPILLRLKNIWKSEEPAK